MNEFKFSLDDNYHVILRDTTEGREIYEVDTQLGTKQLMATLTPERKWLFPAPSVANDFFEAVRNPKYTSIIQNNLFRDISDPKTTTLSKQWERFTKGLSIKLQRKLNKVKYS